MRPHAARTVAALILREIECAPGRSAAGYLWAVAEPVAGILLLTLVFSLAFQAPPLGTSFAYFYASGCLPFLAYHDISQKVAQAIRFSRPLLVYPPVRPLHALAARLLLAALTQVVVVALVLAATIGLSGVTIRPDLGAVAASLGMTVALASGLGTFNCALFEAAPWWERVWAILNRPLFLVSGVLFVVQAIPLPWRDWLLWNPLVHIVGQMRAGLFPTYDAAYVSPAYVLGVAAGFQVAGLFLLHRQAGRIGHG